MLDRHGWRKIMPCPRHPKGDPKVQETFKKTGQSLLSQQGKQAKKVGKPLKVFFKMKQDSDVSTTHGDVGLPKVYAYGAICPFDTCYLIFAGHEWSLYEPVFKGTFRAIP